MFWKLFAHIAQSLGSRCRSCGRPIILTDEYGRAEGTCIHAVRPLNRRTPGHRRCGALARHWSRTPEDSNARTGRR